MHTTLEFLDDYNLRIRYFSIVKNCKYADVEKFFLCFSSKFHSILTKLFFGVVQNREYEYWGIKMYFVRTLWTLWATICSHATETKMISVCSTIENPVTKKCLRIKCVVLIIIIPRPNYHESINIVRSVKLSSTDAFGWVAAGEPPSVVISTLRSFITWLQYCL